MNEEIYIHIYSNSNSNVFFLLILQFDLTSQAAGTIRKLSLLLLHLLRLLSPQGRIWTTNARILMTNLEVHSVVHTGRSTMSSS